MKINIITAAEEQCRKTITDIELSVQEESYNHYTAVYPMHSVLQDYIQKANSLGYYPTFLAKDAHAKAIAKQRRIDGHSKPFHVVALGNVHGLSRFRELANTKEYYGIPDWFKLDEGDTYQVGERKRFRNSNGKLVQKDELLEEVMHTKVFDYMTLITSTPHDWLWLPKEFDVENNIYIEPMENYKGWNDTVKVVKEEVYFLNIIEALKQEKPLPDEFLEELHRNGGIVNITTLNKHHYQLKDLDPDYGGLFDRINETDSWAVPAGHKAQRSNSFDQSNLYYYRKILPPMATLKQAIGRIKGVSNVTPRLVTTQKILDHAEEIHEFSQRVFDNRMFDEKAKERKAWAEDQVLKYPHLFPSKKVKPNRTITKRKQYLGGDESQLITEYRSYTMTENQREEVDKVYELGHAYGKFIIKAVEIFDSKLAKRIKDNYKAIMLKNNERYKFIMGKRTQKFRILVYEGNLIVIEHKEDHYEGCSWHDIDGTIKTSKTISAGTIKRKQ